MNENQMRCFIEAAKEKNFTKAAMNLYLSQPGISRVIAAMEKELGVNLFMRLPGKSLELTPIGRQYYDLFSKFLEEYDSLKSHYSHDSTLSSLKLVIGYSVGWSLSSFLPDVIRQLNEQFPFLKIKVECHQFETLQEKLINKQLDLILTLENNFLRNSAIPYQKLIDLPKIILYSEHYESVHGKITTLADIKNTPFYIYESQSNGSIIKQIESFCKPYNFKPSIVIAPNLESVISCVENGQGVAMLDMWCQPIYMNQFRYMKLTSSHTVICAHRNDYENMSVLNMVIALLTDILRNQVNQVG